MSSEKKVSRRRFLKTVGAGVAVAAAAGAGYYLYGGMTPSGPSATTTTAAKKTLNLAMVAGSRFELPIKAVLPQWNKGHPDININFGYLGGWDETQLVVAKELAAHSGAFDLVHADFVVSQGNFIAGFYLPMDNWIKRDLPDYTSDYAANLREMYQYNGVTYAFPFDANVMVTYLRKDIFDGLGLKVPDDIATWAKVHETVKNAYEKSNGKDKLGMTVKKGWFTNEKISVQLWARGVSLWDQQTFEPAFKKYHDETKDALEFLKSQIQYTPPGVDSWEDGELGNAFNTGDIFLAASEWAGATAMDPKWNKYAAQMDMGPIPKGPGGMTWQVEKPGVTPFMGGAGLAIPATTKYPEEAWEFVKFLQDVKPAPDEKTQLYLEQGGQPGRSSVLGDPGWQKTFPLFKGLALNLPYGVYKPQLIPEAAELNDVIGTITHEYLFGNQSVEDTINAFYDGMYAVFKKSGRYP